MPKKKTIPFQLPNLGQQQPMFDPSQARLTACKCGTQYFNAVYKLGIVSRMDPTNRTGQDILVKFEVYLCKGCGKEYGTDGGNGDGRDK